MVDCFRADLVSGFLSWLGNSIFCYLQTRDNLETVRSRSRDKDVFILINATVFTYSRVFKDIKVLYDHSLQV